MHTSHDSSCTRRWLYFAALNCWQFGFQALVFCRHLVFICDLACTVDLRMLSISPQKRKRSVLSVQQKFEICDCTRNDWTYSRISAEYGIGKSTVFNIIKSDNKLKAFQSQLQLEDCMKTRCIVRMADFPGVDKAVLLWFVLERAAGVPVNSPALMAKASLMYRKLRPEDGTCDKFKAGIGWWSRFRDRRGVHSLHTQGARVSVS